MADQVTKVLRARRIGAQRILVRIPSSRQEATGIANCGMRIAELATYGMWITQRASNYRRVREPWRQRELRIAECELRNWRHTECGLRKELQTTPSKRTVATTGIANCGMRIAELATYGMWITQRASNYAE